MSYPPDTKREYRLVTVNGVRSPLLEQVTFESIEQARGAQKLLLNNMRGISAVTKIQHRDTTDWVDEPEGPNG